MTVDKNYCMSSYLMLRCVLDQNKCFKVGIIPNMQPIETKYYVKTSKDIEKAILAVLEEKLDSKMGLMLSGGMDSAILASYMPRGTKAYTIKNIAEGSINEVERAQRYADINHLDLHVVEVTWEDYSELMPLCMKRKGMPIHSIEPLILKSALQAKSDGCTKLLFGESADCVFGGLDGLLSREWTLREYYERYCTVMPEAALKEPVVFYDAFTPYLENGNVNVHNFLSHTFRYESVNSYLNACDMAGIEFVAPYAQMEMSEPLDLQRIRSGESKYLIRELYNSRYAGLDMAKKLPMPRAVSIWLKDWQGPVRPEFIEGCAEGLRGDQRWVLYCLEKFLDLIEA
ncbi:MAG: asparagine synthase [Clostridia bacterium]|nr:asparagine synthase [Clostridia bacterium]